MKSREYWRPLSLKIGSDSFAHSIFVKPIGKEWSPKHSDYKSSPS